VVGLVVTGGSLTRRPKRSLRYLLVEVPWQINEYLIPTTVAHLFHYLVSKAATNLRKSYVPKCIHKQLSHVNHSPLMKRETGNCSVDNILVFFSIFQGRGIPVKCLGQDTTSVLTGLPLHYPFNAERQAGKL